MKSIDLEEIKIKVTDYKKLTDFFKVYISSVKAIHPEWTLGEWARTLHLETTASLTKIINGQRNVGPAIEKAFSNYFQFSDADLRHFQMLVKNEKVDQSDPLKKIIENEITLTANSKPSVTLSEAEWAQIHTWYFITLRQLSRIVPLPKDNIFLNHLLNTNENIDLVQAIEILAAKGFLIEVKGKFVANDINLVTENNISSESIKKYHEQMGKLALESIRKFDIKNRDLQSCTLSFDRESFSKAQDMIEKFINDFDALLEAPKGDSVYQLNVQFFPLAVIHENSFNS